MKMKGITCCGDCGYYNWKKHKYSRVMSIEADPKSHFFDDCPLPDVIEIPESHVITLEEVRALQDNTVVWVEDNDKADVIPAIINHVWNSLPNLVSFTVAQMREVTADMLWYGVKWRCWTSKPVEKLRSDTPWVS